MVYRADLSALPDSPPIGLPVLCVGWLHKNHSFSTGDVDEEFVSSLAQLTLTASVRRTRGWYRCQFCPRVPTEDNRMHPQVTESLGSATATALGSAEVWVAGEGKIFAAPNMLYHYVVRHGYRPPDEFVEAVKRGLAICPDPQ